MNARIQLAVPTQLLDHHQTPTHQHNPPHYQQQSKLPLTQITFTTNKNSPNFPPVAYQAPPTHSQWYVPTLLTTTISRTPPQLTLPPPVPPHRPRHNNHNLHPCEPRRPLRPRRPRHPPPQPEPLRPSAQSHRRPLHILDPPPGSAPLSLEATARRPENVPPAPPVRNRRARASRNGIGYCQERRVEARGARRAQRGSSQGDSGGPGLRD